MELVKGKVAFITGGTRGIGFAAAKKFIENGAHVAIAGHCQETVDAALAKLKELYPDVEVLGLHPTLTSRQEMLDAVGQVVAKWGRIDVMINNAGVTHSTCSVRFRRASLSTCSTSTSRACTTAPGPPTST